MSIIFSPREPFYSYIFRMFFRFVRIKRGVSKLPTIRVEGTALRREMYPLYAKRTILISGGILCSILLFSHKYRDTVPEEEHNELLQVFIYTVFIVLFIKSIYLNIYKAKRNTFFLNFRILFLLAF